MDMQIISAKSHHIYFDSESPSISQSIPGSVMFKHSDHDKTVCPQIHVRLIRTVQSSLNSTSGHQNQGLLGRVRSQTTTKKNPEESMVSKSVIEVVKLSIPSQIQSPPNPAGPQKFRIPFAIPVPDNLPGSETTRVGQISYAIAASLVVQENKIAEVTQDIHVSRHIIPDQHNIQNAQLYPLSKIIRKVTLTQILEANSKPEFRFRMKLEFTEPISPGSRPNEFTCPTLREVRWHVEEIAKFLVKNDDQSDDPKGLGYHTECTSVRQMCHGTKKGYWGVSENPIVENENCQPQGNTSVDIPFAFAIPKNARQAQSIHLSDYISRLKGSSLDFLSQRHHDSWLSTDERLVITNEHVLRLELISGVDTFEYGTNNLVERAPLRVCIRPTLPLVIPGETGKEIRSLNQDNVPPRYENVSTAPPTYDTFASL